jgi:hypothetical protein
MFLSFYFPDAIVPFGYDFLQSARIAPPQSVIRRERFRPSHLRCCKVGEKTARKRLGCDIELHLMAQKKRMRRNKLSSRFSNSASSRWPYSYKYTKRLSTKIEKCALKYQKSFEKCCYYRKDFYLEITKCKTYPGRKRRECREAVRRRYP